MLKRRPVISAVISSIAVSISNGAIALTSVLVSLIFSEITASEAVGVSHLVLFAMLADVY
jgi:hypothetical protein